MQNKKKITTFLLCTLLYQPLSLFGWSKLTTGIDISCKQTELQLACEYHSPTGDVLNDIEATANQQPLDIEAQKFNVGKDNTIALLFLVDTSDPARQPVIEKNKTHIEQLLQNIKPGYLTGLAAFDKTLRIEAPLSDSTYLLKKKLQGLRAEGKTTELYRNVIQALQYLDQQTADRKVLLLLSDGQAEDKAYFHSDVIKIARDSEIIINTIGYPRTVSLSVALQTLRRISEETGGIYTETDINYQLPGDYVNKAFANIESGGTLTVALTDQNKMAGVTRIKLEYRSSRGNNTLNIPLLQLSQPVTKIETEVPTATKTEAASAVKTETQAPPVTIVTRQVETQPVNLWLWYGIPAAFIIIIILILITLFLLWQRPSSAKGGATNYEFKPYAYLIDENDEDKRYPITRTIWRIGRGKDNELALDDSSISRRHAEIHRNINGGFDIIDMNSMNGIYINGEKVGKAMLEEGDVIEIGDILLKFTQFAPEYAEEESTVMQKTKTPEVSIS